jgi:hypothetical protein
VTITPKDLKTFKDRPMLMVIQVGGYIAGTDDPSLACGTCGGRGGRDTLGYFGPDYLPCRDCNDLGFNENTRREIAKLRELSEEELLFEGYRIKVFDPKKKALLRAAKCWGKLERL